MKLIAGISMIILLSISMGSALAGVDQNEFELGVCYEGDIGDQAEYARFGYYAENMGWGVVEKNEVAQNGDFVDTPQGLPLGLDSYGWVWSSNTYELGTKHYLWKLKIDGSIDSAIIMKADQLSSIVTAENQCPQPIPEFGTAAAIAALAGGAAILYHRRK